MQKQNQNDLILEVVESRIKMGNEKEFHRLHYEILFPILKNYGIKPLCFFVDKNDTNKFIGIFLYSSFSSYRRIAVELLESIHLHEYYKSINNCINGNIQIKIYKIRGETLCLRKSIGGKIL